MADSVTAQDGDTLDLLLWRERGLSIADVPGVLALNAGLGGLGAFLPAGTAVLLPDTPPASTTLDLVNLWD